MKNKRTILFIIILLSFSTLRANTLPKINEEGKLTDICCAFGVELGKKIPPELYRELGLKEEDHSFGEYLAAINWGPYINLYSYEFNPTKPYQDFTIYNLFLIDEYDKVFKITASGVFKDEYECGRRLELLRNIIYDKYESTNRNGRAINFRCERDFPDSVTAYSPVLRWQLKESGKTHNTSLVIEYIDMNLEALKEDIEEQKRINYRKKQINSTDSSGL